MDEDLDYGSEFEDEAHDPPQETSFADTTIASTASQPKVPNKAMQRLQQILANKTITPKPQTEEREIDLSVFDDEDDEPAKTSVPTTPKAVRRPGNNVDEWFAKRAMKTPPSAQRKMKLKDLKKELEAKLATERLEGIELRREVFNADNEIFEENESEEEEEDEFSDSEPEEESQKFQPELNVENPDNFDGDEVSNLDDKEEVQSNLDDDDEVNLSDNEEVDSPAEDVVVSAEEDKENEAPTPGPASSSDHISEVEANSDDDDDITFHRNASRRLHDTIVSDDDEDQPIRLVIDEDDEEEEEASPENSVKSSVLVDRTRYVLDEDGESVVGIGNANDDEENDGFVEDEAALSGSDDDGDADVEEVDSDNYEFEQGDLDKVPDDERIRSQLIKTQLKLETRKDDTELAKLKERFGDISEEEDKENEAPPSPLPVSSNGDLSEVEVDANSDDDDDDITFHRNVSKRAHDTIVSDDEDEENQESSEPPTKKSTFDFDDIFAEDDGDDRLIMEPSDPFAIQHAQRLVIDDDDDEDEEEVKPKKRAKSPVLVDTTRYAVDEDGRRVLGIGNANDNEKSGGFVEDEAALSGSDDGDSDAEEDGSDDYEFEQGDLDNLPDDEKIRSELIKTHLKLEKRKDEDKLVKLKAQFGDVLNTTEQWDRSFRSRMHRLKDVDYSKLLGDPADGIPDDDDDDDEEVTFKEHLERKEAEAEHSQTSKLYSLAANADEEFTDTAEYARDAKSNPNGMAKFIVENFHFQPK